MSKKEKYYNFIIKDLKSKTKWVDASFSKITVGGYGLISTFIQHNTEPFTFAFFPGDFKEYLKSMYGLRDDTELMRDSEVYRVWIEYSEFVLRKYEEKY